MLIQYGEIVTSFGSMTAGITDNCLIWLDHDCTEASIADMKIRLGRHQDELTFIRNDEAVSWVEQWMEKYFAGMQVDSPPVAFTGTAFQNQVWQALLQIGYGEVCSYKNIADRIGNPKAVRAVGQAINRNPISIIVPCHRVIGTDGKLTGYNGGLDKKTYLLNLEQKKA